jgi:CRP-like cAMP-binding protein
MEDSLTLPIGVRIARRLMALAEDFGEEIEITQDQLAAYVGAARESVNRQLRVWQKAGLVAVKRGRIILLDQNAVSAEGRVETP